MKEKADLDACQMSYLSLIQGVVNRMAASSVTIKGFAATIFAGVLAIVITGQSAYKVMALLVAVIAMAVAFLFDWYYFYQEKQYRELYNRVLDGSHACDFVMHAPGYKQITRRGSLKSFSLWAYYGLLEIMLISVLLYCANS